MPIKTNTQSEPSTKQHHFVRTINSAIFGFIAFSLLLLSLVTYWLDQTLTNTDRFVSVTAPLVRDDTIQDFVADTASDALIKGQDVPVREISRQIVGESGIANKSDEQLRTDLKPIVQQNVRNILSTPEFAELWETSLRNAHSQLVTQLYSDSPQIVIDLNPVITGVLDQFSRSEFGFITSNIVLSDEVGKVAVGGGQLETARNVIDTFDALLPVMIISAVLCFILCVVISVHHNKTFRRIAVSTGLFAGLLALLLSAPNLFGDSLTGGNGQLATVLISSLTKDLKNLLIIIAILAIFAALVSKFAPRLFVKE